MAKSDETTGTVVKRNVTEQFNAYMLQRALDNASVDMSEDVTEDQVARILGAENADDIMRADLGGTVQGKNVPGTVWEIHSMRPVVSNRSDLEDTKGYYVQYDGATLLGGDADVIQRNGLRVGDSYPLQTGAILLITKIRALEAINALPARLSLIGIKTGAGFTVLKWGPPPVTTMDGSAS